jgi:hypothetical protein
VEGCSIGGETLSCRRRRRRRTGTSVCTVYWSPCTTWKSRGVWWMVSLTGRCFCCFGFVSDGVSCRGKKRRNTCRVRGYTSVSVSSYFYFINFINLICDIHYKKILLEFFLLYF